MKNVFRKYHIVVIGLAVLMAVISLFFGMSIYNAHYNTPIAHLNEMDGISHYDVTIVPALTRVAAIVTLPIILCVLTLEFIIVRKSSVQFRKNIGRGMILATLIVLLVDIICMVNNDSFNFVKWGYVWIGGALLLFAGNLLSAFIPSKMS